MPIYEYECEACGHEFEALQKISDSPLVDCPKCAKPELRKKISAVGFRLKGSGWYETDFKSGNRKNVAGEAGADKGKKEEGSKDTGKADGAESKSKAKPSEGKSTAASAPAKD